MFICLAMMPPALHTFDWPNILTSEYTFGPLLLCILLWCAHVFGLTCAYFTLFFYMFVLWLQSVFRLIGNVDFCSISDFISYFIFPFSCALFFFRLCVHRSVFICCDDLDWRTNFWRSNLFVYMLKILVTFGFLLRRTTDPTDRTNTKTQTLISDKFVRTRALANCFSLSDSLYLSLWHTTFGAGHSTETAKLIHTNQRRRVYGISVIINGKMFIFTEVQLDI